MYVCFCYYQLMRVAAANVHHLTAAALYVNRIKPVKITHSLTQSLPPGPTSDPHQARPNIHLTHSGLWPGPTGKVEYGSHTDSCCLVKPPARHPRATPP